MKKIRISLRIKLMLIKVCKTQIKVKKNDDHSELPVYVNKKKIL